MGMGHLSEIIGQLAIMSGVQVIPGIMWGAFQPGVHYHE